METGNLSKWRKKEGDLIKPGDVIAEVETDKATVEFEATEEGYLAKILIPVGTKDISVGKPIAIVVENKEDIASFKDFQAEASPSKTVPKSETPKSTPPPSAPSTPPPSAPSTPPPISVQQSQETVPGAPIVPGAPPKSGVFASPLAKSLAASQGLNIAAMKGSGPNGRIVGADVVAYSQSNSAASSISSQFTDLPNSQIRKITAQRLTLSKQTIPHYYLTIDCKMDELMKVRQVLNDKSNGSYKLSVNDFVIKATALALKKVPTANSSWQEDSIRRYNNIDINVAVNTERGLLTPFIKDADKIGLSSIANTMKELAEKAKENKLKPEQFTGGTFTISNLGMFGIKQFAAVINPPQSCILAVGGSEKRVIVNEKATDTSNQFTVANYMSVTLSCDHRVVDGATGAEWLKHFKEYIEDPMKMLL